MASPTPSATQVSVIDAARDAVEHTRRNLFPIRVERWLILGLLAFLDQCGRSWNGGGPGGPGDGGGPDWPDDGEGAGLDGVAESIRSVSEWLAEHAAEVAIGGIALLALIVAFAVVVLWINARGTFLYLDNVAGGRAEVSRPWREHARAANGYFQWRFALTLAGLGVVLVAAVLIAVAAVAVARGQLENASSSVTVLAVVPVLILLLLALPLLALASLALRDFVAPLQLSTGLTCGGAARVLESLVVQHPGAFVLYLLLKLVFSVCLGVAIFVGGCLTCCVGFMPVVLQTLFQPFFYFERAWSVFLLRRMGQDVAARVATGASPAAGGS